MGNIKHISLQIMPQSMKESLGASKGHQHCNAEKDMEIKICIVFQVNM
jgi:hypothetical protein